MASIATADITTSMWGRSALEMYHYSSEFKNDYSNSYAVLLPTWSPLGRVGLNFFGTSDDGNMGFQFQWDYTGNNTVGLDDNAKIWANLGPARLTVGRMHEDDLRGSGAFDDWGLAKGLATRDDMFDKFRIGAGMHIDLAMEGLYLGASVDGANTTTLKNIYGDSDCSYQVLDLGDLYKTFWFQAGYKIEGVGTIKGQLKGNGFNKGEILQFGFHSTDLMDGLEFEIGSRIVPENIENAGLVIPVGVQYTGIDSVTIRFQAEYANGNWKAVSGDNVLRFGLDFAYAMDTIDVGITTNTQLGLASTMAYNVELVPFMRYHASSNGFFFAGVDVALYGSSSNYISVGIPVGLELGL